MPAEPYPSVAPGPRVPVLFSCSVYQADPWPFPALVPNVARAQEPHSSQRVLSCVLGQVYGTQLI